jgi:plastocyanin
MGSESPRFRSLVAVASVLLVVTVGLMFGLFAAAEAAAAQPLVARPNASGGISVGVTNSFTFQPDAFEVQPGQNVSLTISQLGSYAHTFTLFSVDNFSFNPSTNTTNQIIAWLSSHPPLVNVNISDAAGYSTTVSFTAPKYGIYQYVCLEPGHFSLGMDGFMGSGVSPVVTTPYDGPGAPVFIIGGTIVALLVLAIVLGFVVGRRKGSMYEMPPERLGYPEPAPPSTAAPGSPGEPPKST